MIDDFTTKSGIHSDLTSKDSILNDPAPNNFTDTLAFDQSFEGVPPENLIFAYKNLTLNSTTGDYQVRISGVNQAFEFLYNNTTLLADFRATGVPYSGLGGAVFEHGTRNIGLEISGNEVGGGGRSATFYIEKLGGGLDYFAILDNDGSQNLVETTMPIILANLASDPAGLNGMIYYDSANNRLRVYVNSAWITLSGASSELTASDNLQASADTIEPMNTTGYVKVKDITAKYGGTIRVNWSMRADVGTDTAYTKVYVNDVAVSSEYSTQSHTFVDESTDISIKPFDKIQLYAKMSSTNSGYVKNFRLCWDKSAISVDYTVNLD